MGLGTTGPRDYETARLRDYGTTRLRDYGTARLRDYGAAVLQSRGFVVSLARAPVFLRRSQSFSVNRAPLSHSQFLVVPSSRRLVVPLHITKLSLQADEVRHLKAQKKAKS